MSNTPEQDKFLKLLKKHQETTSTDSTHQKFQFLSMEKNNWVTIYFSRESIQSLLDDQTIVEFPNRWSPDQSVIVINKFKGK